MAQSPDPRPASRTSDTREYFDEVEPRAIIDQAIDSAHSISARKTPAPAEAIATKSPTVGAVDTNIAGPDRSRPTSDAPGCSCDAGPPNISNVATTSISSFGPLVLSALQEAPTTNCSTVHETNPTAYGVTGRANAEPTTSFQHSADEHERRDDGLALERQGREGHAENGQQSSSRCDKEVDDMEYVKLVVESALNNMWNQLPENCPQRTVEQ